MANAEHFANIMVERFISAVERGVDLVPVVADSTSTAKIAPFIKAFPDRLVNVGIAEQVLVGYCCWFQCCLTLSHALCILFIIRKSVFLLS